MLLSLRNATFQMEWNSALPARMLVTLKHHAGAALEVFGTSELRGFTEAQALDRLRAVARNAELRHVLYDVAARVEFGDQGALHISTSRGNVTAWFVRGGGGGEASVACVVWTVGDDESVEARATFAGEEAVL